MNSVVMLSWISGLLENRSSALHRALRLAVMNRSCLSKTKQKQIGTMRSREFKYHARIDAERFFYQKRADGKMALNSYFKQF